MNTQAKPDKHGWRRFVDFKLIWNDKLGADQGCHYLTRWGVVFSGFSLRLHHWLHDDDQRHFHDHPWWMLTLVLKGGYTDVSPQGEDRLRQFSLRFRPAEWKHTVRINPGGAWTLLLTGPKVRDWGFWVPGRERLMRPLRYFSRYGHHQCDLPDQERELP